MTSRTAAARPDETPAAGASSLGADSSGHQATTASSPLAAFWRELSTFGIIGVLNIFIDMGLYNWLRAGPLDGKVTTAKIISGAVATVFAWVGNRYWTFRHRENRPLHHEVVLFFAVNGVALAATSAWVAFAHYVLGARGALWENVHALIGIGIGTILRFVAYRTIVFGAAAEDPKA
ncbi:MULTISPECIES: GtrA family protein [Dermacoccus]|uniref:Membrane protein n=1 Tax=Dermacoccus nishinomiyaensis TaxID=1274 RepID=A0A075JIV5_9MICO|nr:MULTISPECIES: GtrA family protein [Dermacoccus]HCQ19492.1 GtrA family protein [Dermacoccus sp.]AIF41730.1 membrane protein [Dermacoccus nishinomiyaensis]EFP59412.1 GtrA-like protein [Dermacoccus sp. Ellin185]MBO1757438.1 GtrA family protein [Dermacoccus sp. NHGro5]MCG7430459.1 GtrA family protein [Dermacoccus nishinomiyaensis]